MSHVRLCPRIIVSNSYGNTSEYEDTMIIFQKLNQKVNDPQMTFNPTSVEVTCVTLLKDHCIWKYINDCGNIDHFPKTLTMWSMTPNDSWMSFNLTSIEVTCETLPKDHCVQLT